MKTMGKFLLLSLGLNWNLCNASPSLSEMEMRAERFEKMGLASIAQEQLRFLAQQAPLNKRIRQKLLDLSERESRRHYKNATEAQRKGALNLAFQELTLALDANPQDSELKQFKIKLTKELELKNNLMARVSQDYNEGLSYYEKNKLDRALECFVKVLNMNPHHKGALAYVDRIGQKLGSQ